MLLAIDTATAMSGLALFDGAVRAEAVWDAGRDHGAQLLPQLTLLCDHLRCRPADLTAIAVTLGPGSWSGLRVGLATAKGLALALDLATGSGAYLVGREDTRETWTCRLSAGCRPGIQPGDASMGKLVAARNGVVAATVTTN